tara:strand:- start:316 stop:1029 length:714 start_codon:yes stop_codon:yes gene_type:complete
MKIVCDKYNIDNKLFLQEILANNNLEDVIQLVFKKNEIYLLNNNYKTSPEVHIDFNKKKFIEKNNKRLKNNHDIFWKIFSYKNSRILDCTGGFGRDGFLLNSMGHDVTIIENSPVVAMILKNALWRYGNKSIKFFFGNAYDYMKHSIQKYNYIYLDFMFEKLKNKSLSSKNDETLKCISFQDNDKNKIIQMAQRITINKVIVKEPINSVSNLLKPNHIIKTKLLNYRVYLGSYDRLK